MSKKTICFFFILILVVSTAHAERQRFVEFRSYRVDIDVSKVKLDGDVWRKVKPYRQPLQRQFLEVPKPVEVGVKEALVQSINDGRHIAFRLVWKDATKNDTIKIMNFSDGAAIQFPVRKEAFPEFFMVSDNQDRLSEYGIRHL
jgi:DMSO reductase family type II enzyme heme b subunit